jgi:hypothetical protein
VINKERCCRVVRCLINQERRAPSKDNQMMIITEK